MSFYTDNRPRLIESNIYNKIIRKNMIDDFMKKEEQKEIKTTFNFSEYTSYFSEFIKNNWSFLLILSILIIILVYRYNVIKEDQELKKARKQYIDQLIMENYRKEKRIECLLQTDFQIIQIFLFRNFLQNVKPMWEKLFSIFLFV